MALPGAAPCRFEKQRRVFPMAGDGEGLRPRFRELLAVLVAGQKRPASLRSPVLGSIHVTRTFFAAILSRCKVRVHWLEM